MMRCDRCSADYAPGSLWCLGCGHWLSSEGAVCSGEEMQAATGACVVCGTPVCASCGIEHEGRTYCHDQIHQDISKDYVMLESFASEFEADWVHKNLTNEGVRTLLFGYRTHPEYYSISLPVEAAVLVMKTDVEKARELIERSAADKGA